MNIDWSNKFKVLKKVFIFIFWSLILSTGISVFLYKYLGNYLNQLSEEQIKEMATNPFYEISRTSFNVYVITYILFSQLPEKVKKAKTLLRGVYFFLFYLFCYIIIIWI